MNGQEIQFRFLCRVLAKANQGHHSILAGAKLMGQQPIVARVGGFHLYVYGLFRRSQGHLADYANPVVFRYVSRDVWKQTIFGERNPRAFVS